MMMYSDMPDDSYVFRHIIEEHMDCEIKTFILDISFIQDVISEYKADIRSLDIYVNGDEDKEDVYKFIEEVLIYHFLNISLSIFDNDMAKLLHNINYSLAANGYSSIIFGYRQNINKIFNKLYKVFDKSFNNILFKYVDKDSRRLSYASALDRGYKFHTLIDYDLLSTHTVKSDIINVIVRTYEMR